MSNEQVGIQALQLPLRDRVRLASSLWESIPDPYELSSDRTDDEALKLAANRDEELAAGSVVPVGHEELMRRLRR